MKEDRVIGALIGLAGAVENNGKTPDTDRIILDALCSEGDAAVEQIHEEKFKISPNCATCSSPCGNTSDYDFAASESDSETENLKYEVINRLRAIASERKKNGMIDLPEIVYKALSYIKYDMAAASYRKLLDEMK